MKRLLHLARLGAFALGCAVLAGAAALLVLEWSGTLARWVRADLAGRLGEPLEIARARLAWFEPALELDGVVLGPEARGLRLERVRVRFARLLLGETAPTRVEVAGGRIVLGDELLKRFEPAGERPQRAPPTVLVEGLAVDLAHPRWGRLPIGTADLVLRSAADGRLELRGRLRPALALEQESTPPPDIFLQGREGEGGMLEVAASVEDLVLGVDALPEHEDLAALRRLALRAKLSLDARVQVALDGRTPPRGTVRASFADGTLRPPTTGDPLTDLSAEIQARFEPPAGASALGAEAWKGRARASGSWRGASASGWLLFGEDAGGGLDALAAARILDLPLERGLIEALGVEALLSDTWSALDPRGLASVAVRFEAPRGSPPRAALEIELAGRAGATLHGWRRLDGEPESGFPLPVEALRGRIAVLRDPALAPPTRLALVDVRGSAGQAGSVRLAGVIQPAERRGLRPSWDVWIDAREVAVDETLGAALAGVQGAEWIWPAFAPSAGALDASGRLGLYPGEEDVAGELAFALHGVSSTWEDLPLSFEQLGGSLGLRLDPRRALGVAFDLEGRTLTSDRARIQGRIQPDPLAPPLAGAPGARSLREIRAELENVALRGADRDVLSAELSGVGEALDQFGATGKADIAFHLARAAPLGEDRFRTEISPRQTRLSPLAFPVESRGVRGRVLVSGSSAEGGGFDVSTRVVPLVGEWAQGEATVAFAGDFPSGRESRMQISGAGVDVSNPNLVAALQGAFTEPERPSPGGLDLSALQVRGRVDFSAAIALPPAGTAPPRSLYRVFLRDNAFEAALRADGAQGAEVPLDHMEGILVQSEGVLQGEEIRATLAEVPVALRQVKLATTPAGLRLETGVEARGLPLDREHLRFLLDEQTIEALVERLSLRGLIDVERGWLELEPSALGGVRTLFSGDIAARHTHFDLGLEVDVESARIDLRKLALEGDHVRAWATVRELEGALAGRKLERGSLELTYVEPHISVLDLDVRCEQGRLRQLADPGRGGEGRAGPAFSIDLVEPFPFDLGLRMQGADVAGLLRGLFDSDFASRGELSGELRLSGDLERVTGIRGDGFLDLRDSTLWSIPVVRDLLAQLGYDETAVFERIRARLLIQGGVVRMPQLDVFSPLLHLSGEGSLDFDGALHHDLELRYGLVDKLGPLTRMVYWIQRGLLTVAIRGDMSRPRVVLKGALSLFQRLQEERRQLPLPGIAPLPARF